jgi:phenylalanyl-tRNA synthetase alpha subunit
LGPANILFTHELAHKYDFIVIKSWERHDFISAINVARSKIEKNFEAFNETFKAMGEIADPVFHDIIGALSDNKINVQGGHINWTHQKRATEIFADLTIYKANKINIPNFNGLLDDIIKVYDSMFGVLV